MEDISPKLLDISMKILKSAWITLNPSKPHQKYNLICVELGHRRCKTALIGASSDTYNMEFTKKFLLDSTGDFFGQTGFVKFTGYLKNLKKELEADKSINKIDGLALSLCCPVNSQDGRIDNSSEYFEGWESMIREKLNEEIGEEDIIIVNDAVAFALGCQDAVIIKKLKLPTLCLTLGGGIGSAFIKKGKRKAILSRSSYFVESFEVGHIHKEWSDGFYGNPHQLAGQHFFEWAGTQTDWNRVKKKQEFSQRIAWIINSIKNEEGKDFSSIVIGGGRSRDDFIDRNTLINGLSPKITNLQVKSDTYLSLQGAARLWLQKFHYEEDIPELVDGKI